jgi:hypothetical protein
VFELFPQVRWALLTGSVDTNMRTAGSDLDVVVVLPDDDPWAPLRCRRSARTFHAHGTAARGIVRERSKRASPSAAGSLAS